MAKKQNGRYAFTLNLYNNRGYNADVYVDGMKLDNKEKKFSAPMKYEFSTDNDVVNVVIKKTFEINCKLYILRFLFYYIISLFGIFDVREKRFNTLDVNLFVDLRKTQVLNLRLNNYVEGGTAAIFDTDLALTEGNVFYKDQVAEKRYKTLKKVKILFTVAVFVIAAAIAVFKIIN